MGDGLIQASKAMVTPMGRVLGGIDPEKAQPFLEELIALGRINQNGTIPGKMGKDYRRDLVKRVVMFLYEFRRHPENPNNYFCKRFDQDIFKPFDKDSKFISDIVNRIFVELFTMAPHTDVSNTVEEIMDSVHTPANLDSGIIKVADKLYWYQKGGYLKSGELGDGDECFYELFDSPISTQFPNINLTYEDGQKIYERYMKVWTDWILPHYSNEEDFGDFYHDLPMEYEFIKVWADPSKDGSQDRYWDLLLAVVSSFLYKKPVASYFLLGNARGGKSSYTKMLHLIFGRNNTSTLCLSELSDKHKNLALASTLLNAPDEETESTLSPEDMKNYKSLSAHEYLELPVFYSQNPKKIATNFMMYLPSNALPKFNGSGAEACMKRAKVIMFSADLSKMDSKPGNFIKDTFTHELLDDLLGTVLAFAKFFTEKEFWWSPAMLSSNEFVSSTVSPSEIYFHEWNRFFDGVSSVGVLYKDYQMWCKMNDLKWEPMDIIKNRFMSILSKKRTTYYDPDTKQRPTVYRDASGKYVMYDGFVVPRVKESISDLHDVEKSAVYIMKELAEAELADAVGMKQASIIAKARGEE